MAPRSSSLSDLVRSTASIKGFRARSIIEFAESPMGANQKLFPVQRFFIKLINKEEMDNTRADIVIEHPIEASGRFALTEAEYHELLYNNNRINLSPDEYMTTHIREYLMPWGRRGTKSTIVAIIQAYELDEILKIPNPQKYFGIAEADRISVTYVGLGKDNAEKLFSKSAKIISSVRSMAAHIPEKPTNSKLKIFTRDDLDGGNRDDKGMRIHSLELAAHANSPGLRGDNNITNVFEEFAHFNVGAKSTKELPLDEEIYDALTPSNAAFSFPSFERMVELHQMDSRYPIPNAEFADQPYGKSFLLSSPLRTKGKFYTLCQSALEEGAASGKLMVNIPTWEINPLVKKSYFMGKYKDSPSAFDREFGALFTKGGVSWFKNLGLFYRAFDSRIDAKTPRGNPSKIYFAGLDFALANDGVALALCSYDPTHVDELPDPNLPPPTEREGKFNIGSAHPELYKYRTQEHDEMQDYTPMRGRYSIDHIDYLYPEPGTILNMDHVVTWIANIYGSYRVFGGIFDQWAGDAIEQQLHKNPGLQNLKKVNFGEILNSELAKTFMHTVNNDILRMPLDDEMEECLLGLREDARRKGVIKVEVPANEGHDDIYSAISRAVFLAKAYHEKNKPLLEQLLGEQFAAQTEERTIVRVGARNGLRHPQATANHIRKQLGVAGGPRSRFR